MVCTAIILNFTLYPAHCEVDRGNSKKSGNLILRYSVPPFKALHAEFCVIPWAKTMEMKIICSPRVGIELTNRHVYRQTAVLCQCFNIYVVSFMLHHGYSRVVWRHFVLYNFPFILYFVTEFNGDFFPLTNNCFSECDMREPVPVCFY